jgi:hypothetical protein
VRANPATLVIRVVTIAGKIRRVRRFTDMTNLKLTLLAAAAAAGCATTPTAPHDNGDPLATITSTTGTTVELYTAGTGFLAIEYGDMALPRVLDDLRGLTLADVYRIASGEAPPPDLEALSAEMASHKSDVTESRAVVRDHSPPQLVTPGVAYSGGSCTPTWLENHGYCGAGGGGTDWSLLNWWNGAYEHLNGVNHSSAVLCADIGDIVWEIHNGDGGNHTLTVLEGQMFFYGLSSDDLFGTWLNYDVTHASNNRFNFCGWAS